jgi:hypothetical protein
MTMKTSESRHARARDHVATDASSSAFVRQVTRARLRRPAARIVRNMKWAADSVFNVTEILDNLKVLSVLISSLDYMIDAAN